MKNKLKFLISLIVGLGLMLHSVGFAAASGRVDVQAKPPTHTPQPSNTPRATNTVAPTATSAPDYQLNLSHISCAENAQVEVHFVVTHIEAGDVLSNVLFVANGNSYEANLTNQNAHEAGFTAYLPAGVTYDVTQAVVTLNGVVVGLHNPSAYNDVLCSGPAATPTTVPPTVVPPTATEIVPPTATPERQNSMTITGSDPCDSGWLVTGSISEGGVMTPHPGWSGPWGDNNQVTIVVDGDWTEGEPRHISLEVTVYRSEVCPPTDTPVPPTPTEVVPPTATEPGQPTNTPEPDATPTVVIPPPPSPSGTPVVVPPQPGTNPAYFSAVGFCNNGAPTVKVGMSEGVWVWGFADTAIRGKGEHLITLDANKIYNWHIEWDATHYWMVDMGNVDGTIDASKLCPVTPNVAATQPVVKGGGAGRTTGRFPIGEFGGGALLFLVGAIGMVFGSRKRQIA